MSKNIKNISIYLLLVIFIVACKTIKPIDEKEVAGVYQWSELEGIECYITLKEDGSFIYNWQTGLDWGTTTGSWELYGNELVLNSKKQPTKEDVDEQEKDTYLFFTNEKWKLRNGRIYDPEIKKSKYVKKNYFEKVEM